MHGQAQPWWVQIVMLVVLAAVIALRWRGMKRARRLRLETLWIIPALYAAGVAYAFYRVPPPPSGWLWCALALAAGSAIGWQRGRMMRIAIDPETHRLSQQGSPAALLLLIALIAARQALRFELGNGHAAMLALGIAMAAGLGMVAATRLEMAIRARRMLAMARRPVPAAG